MSHSPRQRYGAVTATEVAALDDAALALGLDIEQLMEVAGFQVARLAWRMLRSRPGRVHVVAGPGNNGGDALVAARHLAAWGCPVIVALVADPARLRPLIEQQCGAARGAGARLTASVEPAAAAADAGTSLFVDGLLGTGLSEPPRPTQAAVIRGMRGRVLSIDVPSGLDATSGTAPGAAVEATATCTLAACKLGLWAAHARRWIGVLHVADIGMPATAWAHCGLIAPTAVRGGRLHRVPLEAGAKP